MSEQTICVVDAAEPLWLSAARDTFSTATMVAGAVMLNTLMPPSGWINAAWATAWFLWMLGRALRHRTHKTADEARAWLDEHYPREP